MSLALSVLRRRLSKLPASVTVQCLTRNYSTEIPYLTLPPPSEWRSVFSPIPGALRDRVSISNSETANLVARSFLEGKSIAAGSDKIIIEAFPGKFSSLCCRVHCYRYKFFSGPGALSRAILALESSRVKKLIILEDNEQYLQYLRVSTINCTMFNS
jgi:mitochondrial transcription factor 1